MDRRVDPGGWGLGGRSGFTYLEAMLVVAVIAVLAGAALALFGSIQRGTDSQKLRQEVASLNSAIEVFQASGGYLGGLGDAQEVVAALKTVATGEQMKTAVGLKGNAIDPRMSLVVSKWTEGVDEWVHWDPGKRRFEVRRGRPEGDLDVIVGFGLSRGPVAVEPAERARQLTLQYAVESTWVWDYNDTGEPTPPPLKAPVDHRVAGSPGSPIGTASPVQLQAPVFSIPSGAYPLGGFDLSLQLRDPNPPGVSEILYSTASGYSRYSAPITVRPGSRVAAIAVSIDPGRYTDSGVAAEDYSAVPAALGLDFTAVRGRLNYIEAGGELAAGGTPSSARHGLADINLSNGAGIPQRYQNSGTFSVYWTTDGSDPRTSGSRSEAPPFSNGFPGQDVAVRISQWVGGSPTANLKAVAVSLDPAIAKDSPVEELRIGIEPIALDAPVIVRNGKKANISLPVGGGRVPAGARVYYTTDGTDPGDDGGEPVTGKLYKKYVKLKGGAHVVARVYPPSSYPGWFEVSAPAELRTAAPIGFAMRVSTSAP